MFIRSNVGNEKIANFVYFLKPILSQGLADHDIVDHPCVSLRFGFYSNGKRLHISKF